MNRFLISDLIRTGRAGLVIGIGKGEEPGVSRTIKLDLNKRDRNYDIKGKSNISRGLRSSDISNKYKSRKDSPGYGNLKSKNKNSIK